jgi:hypothetical protein
MKRTTRAIVICAECGDRHTFVGTQWEVTVTAQVWQKTHGRAAHNGGKAVVRAGPAGTRRGSAGPGGRV